jgi:hypothetical protein
MFMKSHKQSNISQLLIFKIKKLIINKKVNNVFIPTENTQYPMPEL